MEKTSVLVGSFLGVALLSAGVLFGQNPVDSSQQNAPPAATGGVSRPGKDGVGYPACAYCPNPAYTQQARKAKFEGVVQIQAVIGPDGRATDIKVLKKVGYGLEDVSVKTVQNWRFKPALGPDGKPVAVLAPIEVTFRLR